MEVSRFEEKLNKIDGNNYVIEEKALLCEGVYNGELKHDNINPATLAVFTGPRLTGDRIQTYSVSTPSLTPWKKVIKVFADTPEVYISYETDGDTVEAEDINRLQEAVSKTQTAVNTETERAGRAEEKLKEELVAEVERAKDSEAETAGRLLEESGRARLAERELRDGLDTEVKRAGGEEEDLKQKLLTETGRAENAEQVLRTGLAEEAARAKEAEKLNRDAVSAEAERAKGEEAKLQTGIQNEISRAGAAEAAIRDAISSKEPKWNDKYTRNEVDNKFAVLETAIDWKEAVNTYADLKAVYPAPEDGWTVNVKDTDYTYRWSGTEWIAISANAIPKATQNVDGLLSREDKSAYDEAYSKRHVHTNQSALDSLTDSLMANWTDAYGKRHEHANRAVIDKVTQTLIDNWNAAFTHIGSKSNPHGVTKAQAGLGNVPNVATNDQTPTFTQGTVLENITSGEKLTAMLGKISKAVADLISHKADAVSHVTASERTAWNETDTKKHTHGNKGVIDKLTQAMLDKLAGIAQGAGVNVQADWIITDAASDAYIKNKPVSMPASDVPSWAKAASKPSYGWTEISGKPGAFTPAAHSHTNLEASNITGQTVDVNSYNLSSGNPQIQFYSEKTSGGAANITNIPVAGQPFLLKVESLRWASATDYITKQTFLSSTAKTTYERYCTNGSWGSWLPIAVFNATPVSGRVLVSDGTAGGIKSSAYTIAASVPSGAKFTDTVYAHPNSGAAAGTYRGVTVNAQGHVTAGTNPTTLAGYGITDAAPKSHNHDGAYMPMGPFSWAQMHGAYTWNQLKGV